MRLNTCDAEKRTAIRTDLGAIFASLELSRSTWLITSLSPGTGEKMSKYTVRDGDIAGLLARFAEIKEKARRRVVRSAAKATPGSEDPRTNTTVAFSF
jgi:transposase